MGRISGHSFFGGCVCSVCCIVMSCPVLPGSLLSCLILSGLVCSCVVVYCRVLPWSLLSWLILSGLVLSTLFFFELVFSRTYL
jgi:hypothetical protein